MGPNIITLFASIFLLIISPIAGQRRFTVPGGCPTGWYKLGDKRCVRYFSKMGNYTEGQKLCDTAVSGSDMLSIHNQAEQDFITALTYNKPQPYIGLTKSAWGSAYTWEDQSKNDFDNWGNQVGHVYYYYLNCATMVTNKTQPGKWIRTNCSESHPVICQTKQQDPKLTTGLTLPKMCNITGYGNYIQYRNSCYNVIGNTNKMSFADAEQNCQKSNAHLVSIVDPFEAAFLNYYMNRNGNYSVYWIGLQNKMQDPSETDNPSINETQIFEWTDDWPMYFTNWGPRQPRTTAIPQDQCVYMSSYNGQWFTTTNCDQKMGYVCKVSLDKPPQLPNNKNGYCPSVQNNGDSTLNWVNLHKGTPYCYWFSTERREGNPKMSYTGAQYTCNRRNGTLVSIHTEHELQLLVNRLSKKVPNFVSWLGLSRAPSGEFQWTDNSPVDFLNGLPTDELSNSTDLNDDSSAVCAELRWDGTWQWGSCLGNELNYFVCQTPKLFSNPSSTSSGGKTAGIVIGVLLAIAVVAGVVYYMRKNNKLPAMPSFDNPLNRSQRGNGIKPEKFENNAPTLTHGTNESPFRDDHE